ncbi:putative disease resistance RPP13-like protein 3 [Corylus avellana]|uniref:putative disease resistance RPP13-like protein 3 n=1 Tax=Corylus avellana TaxID=13451 RepID=UPI00286BD593|nr:putative disease resistance RPP13-like protein 3 [Corylus avellana]
MGDNPVTFLLQYLPEVLAQEANYLRGVEEQVNSLQRELSLINIFLENSEGKRNEHAIVKEVVRQIRDVAHEAHDVIDTFILSVAKHKRRSTVGKIFYSVTHANMLRNVAMKIEAINREINQIFNNRERYNIERAEGREHEAAEALHRRRREVEEDYVVGLTDNWMKLEEKLIGGDPKLDVISIIGMGGLGKTTLSRKIYNSSPVRKVFDCHVWVYVSQDFQTRELLVKILKEMQIPEELRRRLKYLREDKLKKNLFEYLQGKKYFVVMDDIWSAEVLNEVRSVFPDNCNGSRILITSRNKKVTLDIHGSSDPYLLPFLKEDESWKLFLNKVFHGGHCPPELEALGRQMVKSCGGLPLSIVVLGGLLANKEKTHRIWFKLFGNVKWHLKECKDILALSYTHLPRHLKPCFLYLGVDSKDFEIPVKQLTNLWIAEGFIPHTHSMDPKDVAEDYFEQLIDRSLVQVASLKTDGGVKTCRIHDLLRDFCMTESLEEKFLEVLDVKHLSANKSRRLSIQGSIDPYISSNPSHPTFVRSLLFHGDDTYGGFDPNHWEWVHENFKLVRVLSFKHVNLYSIPTMIAKLIHLRYLGIESDALKVIPASICNLVNLETLDMRGTSLNHLPKGIWKLRHLRNLYMSGPVSLPDNLNPDVKAMWNLQVLSTISLDLQNMPLIAPTIRKLGIWFASNESNCGAIDVLASLSGLASLQTLKIINCSEGHRFPSSFPSTITKITLREVYLGMGGGMTVLGQLPSLHVLKLRSCFLSDPEVNTGCPPGLEVVPNSFPVLEVLNLEELEIEKWEQGIGAMPRLMCLVIKECNELKMLPPELSSLNALREVEVSRSNPDLIMLLHPLQRNLGFNLLIK